MLKLSLIKIEKEKIKDKQEKIYNKIFSNMCNTINSNAEEGKMFCLFIVPDFLPDEITYPFDECIDYLHNKIKYIKKDKQITDVSFYAPNVYYFKWDM